MGGSKKYEKIVAGIKEIAGFGKYELFSGEVESVNETDATCDVAINEGVVVFDVRLKAIIDTTEGFYVIPKKGSHVVIAQIDGGQDFALLQASVIDKIIFKIGTTTGEITSNGIVFNGGNNNGLVKVQSLTTQLNNLENTVNSLIQTLQTVVVPLAPSGTYPFAPVFASITPLVTTQQTTIENTKVKH